MTERPNLDGRQAALNNVDGDDEFDDDEYEIVTLVEEDGSEHDYAIIDDLEIDGGEYAVLAPVEALESEEDDPDIQVLVMRYDGDDLVEIEDDEEAARVTAKLAELAQQGDV